jgi:hypothetical protein
MSVTVPGIELEHHEQHIVLTLATVPDLVIKQIKFMK